MKEIEQIYCNDFGVAFYWKKDDVILYNKVQVIFRETGFYFTSNELSQFGRIIDSTLNSNCCNNCANHKCSKFLLKTPFTGLELAVSKYELAQIKDLIEGALFKIQLSEYINNSGQN